MKILKYSLLLLSISSFTSCLKSRSDVGGLLNDKGNVLVSIVESSYYHTDGQNIGLGYDHTIANFNFSKRPDELVKFFTIKISQPRETKMTGPIVLKVKASPISIVLNTLGTGGIPEPVPTGAITVSDITIPQSSADVITIPVFFKVNKVLLNATVGSPSSPLYPYGVNFKLTSTSQGIIGQLDGDVNVLINYSDMLYFPGFTNNTGVTHTSDYQANYNYNAVVTDPSGQLGINNNKKMFLIESTSGTELTYFDPLVHAEIRATGTGYGGGATLYVYNYFTGARVSLFQPRFAINGSGKITGISGTPGIILDPASGPNDNQFTYTSNNVRNLTLRYIFPYTTIINGLSTTRTLTVKESFSYDNNQVYQ